MKEKSLQSITSDGPCNPSDFSVYDAFTFPFLLVSKNCRLMYSNSAFRKLEIDPDQVIACCSQEMTTSGTESVRMLSVISDCPTDQISRPFFHDTSAAQWYEIEITPFGEHVSGDDSIYCLNVHARTHAQQEIINLQQSEQNYRDLIDLIFDGVFELDKNGYYSSVSALIEQRSGLSLEEFKKIRFLDIIHPDSQQLARTNFELNLSGQHSPAYELVYYTADGGWQEVEVCSLPQYSNGEIVGVRGLSRNITEKKKILRQLEENEAALRAVFEAIPDLILRFNRDGTIRFGKTAHRADLVPNDQTLAGKTINEIFPVSIASLFQRHCEDTLQSGEINCFEFQLPGATSADRSRSFEVRMTPSGEGDVFTVIRDITEQKSNERDLIDSEIKYRTVVEQSADSIFLMDLETLRILEANQTLQSMLGYTDEELRQSTLADFSGQAAEEIESLCSRILEENRVFLADHQYRHKDGRSIDVEVSVTLMHLKGNDVLSFVSRDVTNRKKAESQLVMSLREKEILLKEIHHRVKNNLQIVSSLLNLQARRVKDHLIQEKFQDCQARIHAMSLIHTQLYQSRNLAIIDFHDYISGLISYLFRLYDVQEEQIQLILDFDDIVIDLNTAIQCGLIANELVSNALKHAFPEGEKGTITVGMKRQSHHEAVFFVLDNGVGLSENALSDTTDTLGLTMVTALVDQIGGNLDVPNVGGTSIRITFPLQTHGPL